MWTEQKAGTGGHGIATQSGKVSSVLACPQEPLSYEINTSLQQLVKFRCAPPAVFLSILKVLSFIFAHDWGALMLSQRLAKKQIYSAVSEQWNH